MCEGVSPSLPALRKLLKGAACRKSPVLLRHEHSFRYRMLVEREFQLGPGSPRPRRPLSAAARAAGPDGHATCPHSFRDVCLVRKVSDARFAGGLETFPGVRFSSHVKRAFTVEPHDRDISVH